MGKVIRKENYRRRINICAIRGLSLLVPRPEAAMLGTPIQDPEDSFVADEARESLFDFYDMRFQLKARPSGFQARVTQFNSRKSLFKPPSVLLFAACDQSKQQSISVLVPKPYIRVAHSRGVRTLDGVSSSSWKF
ncbi:unnamed protein product [Linum tenue]|uniref:Uncharacterized protein n=1 Tax=Linum tenue TaxID=586396 RepID=A0AAV0KW95_9ROSI|nr:unnamed protein product [Linum tenue]